MLIKHLSQHMGEQATIVTHDHRTYSGKICFCFLSDEKECYEESIVLHIGESKSGLNYIEFFEKDICRIYIHQGEENEQS